MVDESPRASQLPNRLQGQKNRPSGDVDRPAVFLWCRKGSGWPAACGTGDPGVAPSDGWWPWLGAWDKRTTVDGAT